MVTNYASCYQFTLEHSSVTTLVRGITQEYSVLQYLCNDLRCYVCYYATVPLHYVSGNFLMYMHMSRYTYCTCTMYTYTYTCICTCTHAHVHVHVHLHVLYSMLIQFRTHAHAHMHMHMYMYMYMYIYMYCTAGLFIKMFRQNQGNQYNQVSHHALLVTSGRTHSCSCSCSFMFV